MSSLVTEDSEAPTPRQHLAAPVLFPDCNILTSWMSVDKEPKEPSLTAAASIREGHNVELASMRQLAEVSLRM